MPSNSGKRRFNYYRELVKCSVCNKSLQKDNFKDHIHTEIPSKWPVSHIHRRERTAEDVQNTEGDSVKAETSRVDQSLVGEENSNIKSPDDQVNLRLKEESLFSLLCLFWPLTCLITTENVRAISNRICSRSSLGSSLTRTTKKLLVLPAKGLVMTQTGSSQRGKVVTTSAVCIFTPEPAVLCWKCFFCFPGEILTHLDPQRCLYD